MDEAQFIEATRRVMSDQQTLEIHISIMQLWILVSAIQLTTRHPGLHKPLKEALIKVAHQFEDAITLIHPEATELLAAGWDPHYDVE